MNKARRKEIEKIVEQIDDLKTEVEQLAEEEGEARDSLPESLQESEKWEKMDEATTALEDAAGSLEECIENLNAASE